MENFVVKKIIKEEITHFPLFTYCDPQYFSIQSRKENGE